MPKNKATVQINEALNSLNVIPNDIRNYSYRKEQLNTKYTLMLEHLNGNNINMNKLNSILERCNQETKILLSEYNSL